jgi:hypothetical protein
VTPGPERWEIPRRVWFILLSWGLAVLVLAGLLSFWIWSNERRAAAERDALQREQDQAMCAMIDLITAGPEPVAGPAGDRSRAVLAAMHAYQSALRCHEYR